MAEHGMARAAWLSRPMGSCVPVGWQSLGTTSLLVQRCCFLKPLPGRAGGGLLNTISVGEKKKIAYLNVNSSTQCEFACMYLCSMSNNTGDGSQRYLNLRPLFLTTLAKRRALPNVCSVYVGGMLVPMHACATALK